MSGTTGISRRRPPALPGGPTAAGFTPAAREAAGPCGAGFGMQIIATARPRPALAVHQAQGLSTTGACA